MLEITSIRITKLESTTNIKGIVSIIFNHQFVVKSIRIAENQGSLFLLFPNKGQYSNKTQFKESYVHPIYQEIRKSVTETVINCFKECEIGWNQFDFETNNHESVISQVIFYDGKEDESILKSVSIVLDEAIAIHDIEIKKDGSGELTVAYPEVIAHEKTHPIVYPYTKEIESLVNQIILDLYKLDPEKSYRKYVNGIKHNVHDAVIEDYTTHETKDKKKENK